MTDVMRLKGRCALVTGAATGIGNAIASALKRAGARVAVTDLDGRGAAGAAEALGEGAIGLELDVTNAEQTEGAFSEVIERLGGLDIVCANAGVSSINRVVDLTEEDWNRVMRVNAKGVFLTNREAVRHFLARGTNGAIVNTASIAGKVGGALYAHYCASKFAVVGFTQSLAREVAEHGIRVNAVCPGFVSTSMQDREVVWEGELRGMAPEAVRLEYVSMTPLGRLQEPEDIADVVVFLVSDAARMITGQAINITGGLRMD